MIGKKEGAGCRIRPHWLTERVELEDQLQAELEVASTARSEHGVGAGLSRRVADERESRPRATAGLPGAGGVQAGAPRAMAADRIDVAGPVEDGRELHTAM